MLFRFPPLSIVLRVGVAPGVFGQIYFSFDPVVWCFGSWYLSVRPRSENKRGFLRVAYIGVIVSGLAAFLSYQNSCLGVGMDDLDLVRLNAAVGSAGLGTVAEHIGITSAQVEQILNRELDLEPAGMDIVNALLELVGDHSGCDSAEVVEQVDFLEAEGVEDLAPAVVGVDLDGDGRPDIQVSTLPAGPGTSWDEEYRLKRDSLRRSLAFAQMSRFRVDLTHQEYVVALGIVTQIELALISWFGESVPDPNENWDASRCWRETERRLARLRWVSDEQAKEYSGMKGILNRIIGRRRLNGKEMYERLVADADWLVEAMREGKQDADVINQVMGYVGLDGNSRLPSRRSALPSGGTGLPPSGG